MDPDSSRFLRDVQPEGRWLLESLEIEAGRQISLSPNSAKFERWFLAESEPVFDCFPFVSAQDKKRSDHGAVEADLAVVLTAANDLLGAHLGKHLDPEHTFDKAHANRLTVDAYDLLPIHVRNAIAARVRSYTEATLGNGPGSCSSTMAERTAFPSFLFETSDHNLPGAERATYLADAVASNDRYLERWHAEHAQQFAERRKVLDILEMHPDSAPQALEALKAVRAQQQANVEQWRKTPELFKHRAMQIARGTLLVSVVPGLMVAGWLAADHQVDEFRTQVRQGEWSAAKAEVEAWNAALQNNPSKAPPSLSDRASTYMEYEFVGGVVDQLRPESAKQVAFDLGALEVGALAAGAIPTKRRRREDRRWQFELSGLREVAATDLVIDEVKAVMTNAKGSAAFVKQINEVFARNDENRRAANERALAAFPEVRDALDTWERVATIGATGLEKERAARTVGAALQRVLRATRRSVVSAPTEPPEQLVGVLSRLELSTTPQNLVTEISDRLATEIALMADAERGPERHHHLRAAALEALLLIEPAQRNAHVSEATWLLLYDTSIRTLGQEVAQRIESDWAGWTR